MYNMNDFNEYDMALELAEREYLALTIQEILAMVQRELNRKWTEKAQLRPDAIRKEYTQMIGRV